jgi:hypothetical protein
LPLQIEDGIHFLFGQDRAGTRRRTNDPFFRYDLVDFLKDMGVEVFEAENADLAIELS